MDQNRTAVLEMQINRTIEQLKKNQMDACYVPNKELALQKVKEWLKPGSTVACGGSMTLEECGIMDLLRNGAYHFLDRNAPGITPEMRQQVYQQAFGADA